MIDNIKYDERGLVQAISQDAKTGAVLIAAYANEEALRLTFEKRLAHYYSRSRKKIWMKGEESGNVQRIVEIRHDCDRDSVLYIVEQEGAACHTGSFSCFGVPQEISGAEASSEYGLNFKTKEGAR